MRYLQKGFTILFIICSLLGMPLYAKTSPFFTQISVGISAVQYGDSEINKKTETVKDLDDSFSFIISTDASLGIILSEEVRLVAGGYFVSDINTNREYYANHLDYGMFSGVRIYTGLAGLVFGVDYDCGSCSSFYNLEDDGTSSDTTAWGNGYRFLLEYDFSNGTERFAPILDLSWRHMPRGSYSDNNFTVSFKLSV
ncbi:MAG: hypothetical protein BKP49_06570 [Treponema sp. CETP13]|nr:MAG: hypothetical protein BKP49_06570 [Treponema sp. CETP13]